MAVDEQATTEERMYVVAEYKPHPSAEDPWLTLRKPVLAHPGVCDECGKDICLDMGLHSLSPEDTRDTNDKVVFSRHDPWERIDPDIKRRVIAGLADHKATVHSRFNRRVMAESELPIQNHDGKQITLAERRAIEAKRKRANANKEKVNG